MKTKVYTDFKCPACGGNRFGTSDVGRKTEKGNCHDFLEDGNNCRFTWSRPSEDKKVFRSYFYNEKG